MKKIKIVALTALFSILLCMPVHAYRFFVIGPQLGVRSASLKNLLPEGDPSTVSVESKSFLDLQIRLNLDKHFSYIIMDMKNFGFYAKFISSLGSGDGDTGHQTVPIKDVSGAEFIYPFNMLWTLKFLYGSALGKGNYILGGMIYRPFELLYGVEGLSGGTDAGLGDYLFAAGPAIGYGKTLFKEKLDVAAVYYHSWGWYSNVNEIDLFAEYTMPGNRISFRTGYNLLDANGLTADDKVPDDEKVDEFGRQAAEALIHYFYVGAYFCLGEDK